MEFLEQLWHASIKLMLQTFLKDVLNGIISGWNIKQIKLRPLLRGGSFFINQGKGVCYFLNLFKMCSRKQIWPKLCCL